MRDTELFQLALGLTSPWHVESCKFDLDKHRLDVKIDFPRGSVFACPSCGKEGCGAYDTEQQGAVLSTNYQGIRIPLTEKFSPRCLL